MLLDDVILKGLVLAIILWFALIIDKGFNIFWLLKYEN